MTKVSIVILADTETHEGLGRAASALEIANDLKRPLLAEFEGHPSLRKRLSEGYQVITF